MGKPDFCYKCCCRLWKKNGVLVCPCGVPTTTYVAPEYSAEELAKRKIKRDYLPEKFGEAIFKYHPNIRGSSSKKSRDKVIFIREKISKKQHRKSLRKEPELRKCVYIWTPPREGHFKVNIDGSLRKKNSGGYGAIVRDHTGKTFGAAAGVSVGPISKFYHRLEGVLKGLELAKNCGCRKVCVFIDSHYACSVLWKNYGLFARDCIPFVPRIVDKIDKLAAEFEYCDFTHCPRPCNKAADYLSKLHKEIEFDVRNLPTKLNNIVERDARSSVEKDARW